MPGKRIPYCPFSAEFSGGSISPLKYIVKLVGAKKPHDSFLIKPPAAIYKTTTSTPEGISRLSVYRYTFTPEFRAL